MTISTFKTLKFLAESSALIFWSACVPLLMFSCYLANNTQIEIFQGFLSVNKDPRIITADILLSLGSSVIFIGFLGMFSISKKNHFLMSIYLMCLFIIIMMELIFCVFYARMRDENEDSLNYELLMKIRSEYPSDSDPNLLEDPVKQQIDNIQFIIGRCCGVFGPDDWTLTDWYTEENQAKNYFVPRSCCNVDRFSNALHRDVLGNKDYANCLATRGYYKHGCLPDLLVWLDRNFSIVVGITYAFIAVELLGMVSTAAFIVYLTNAENKKLDEEEDL